MGTTTESESQDIFHDQKWVLCANCGCLQLSELIPLEILYSKQHSAGAIGKIWENHHISFAKFILMDSPKSICEIGAAHSELSHNIIKSNPTTKYLIIEPNPVNVDKSIKLIRGFVEDHLEEIHKYESVVHSHVLEHIYNPRKFILNLAENMSETGTMYISFPNIERLIETGGSNSLNFEHTYFLHPIQFKDLLSNFGFQVLREEKYLEHSYFYKIGKSKKTISNSKISDITRSAETFKEMWTNLRKFVEKVNTQVTDNSIPTYLFGAHIFSQGLISLGLKTSFINGILDNSIAKQGERLYGTSLKVLSFESIRGLDSVRVILKASHYQSEIRNQIISLNPRAQILE